MLFQTHMLSLSLVHEHKLNFLKNYLDKYSPYALFPSLLKPCKISVFLVVIHCLVHICLQNKKMARCSNLLYKWFLCTIFDLVLFYYVLGEQKYY